MTDVAFVNPDNSLVTVVVNQTAASQSFTLRAGARQFTATLPAKTTGTYVWAGAGDAGAGPSRTGQITGYGGKCVDVAGASSANGTAVQLYTCNGTTAQSWTVGTDGTRLQIWDCAASANQKWTLPA